MATGDVIGELNADDVYEPGALARGRRRRCASTRTRMWLTGYCRIIDGDGREIRQRGHRLQELRCCAATRSASTSRTTSSRRRRRSSAATALRRPAASTSATASRSTTTCSCGSRAATTRSSCARYLASFRMVEGTLSMSGFRTQFREHAEQARRHGDGHRAAVARQPGAQRRDRRHLRGDAAACAPSAPRVGRHGQLRAARPGELARRAPGRAARHGAGSASTPRDGGREAGVRRRAPRAARRRRATSGRLPARGARPPACRTPSPPAAGSRSPRRARGRAGRRRRGRARRSSSSLDPPGELDPRPRAGERAQPREQRVVAPAARAGDDQAVLEPVGGRRSNARSAASRFLRGCSVPDREQVRRRAVAGPGPGVKRGVDRRTA